MSKSQKSRRREQPQVRPPARPWISRLATVALVVGTIAAGAFWWNRGRHADAARAEVPAAAASVIIQAVSLPATSMAAVNKLKGQWLRPDGGYILEIRDVKPDGTVDAGYFNPRPIHVAKAQASLEGQFIKVFIELRDVNYPGSTYTLYFNAASDHLAGNYFQAAQGATFEGEFVRRGLSTP